MYIQTVQGWKEADELGKTYCHEHLQLDLSGQKQDPDTNFDDLEAVIAECSRLADRGLGALVEVTNRGMGRNVAAMQRVSSETGIHVIASTGFYKEPYLPDYFYTETEAALVRMLLTDILEGMDGTGVRAHVIGEVGTSRDQITDEERRLFRVAAAAHCETGHPVYTHTTLGTMALEQLALLKERGVDLTRVAIGHLDLACDREYHLRIADQGCFLAFDTIGKLNYERDEARAEHLRALFDRGHGGQILLSQDVTRKSHLEKNGGIGYSYLLDKFVPLLQEYRFTDSDLEQVLVTNPGKFLAVSR
ncbi:MAG: phosphotriesterase-related protein [Firmicutes bacterium]|nr:phosphotriesterase-related protein [Bacillota bacterium]